MNLASDLLWLAPGLVGLAIAALTFVKGRQEIDELVRIEAQPLKAPLLVCIPARNEAERIGPTLDALLRERHPDLRVVVLDDDSDDDTAKIVDERAARDTRLSRATPTGTLEGFGKPRALDAALAAATDDESDVVLFLDADVLLEEGALGGLLAAYRERAAHALSGVPRMICKGPVEAALVPAFVALLGARFRISRVHDDNDPQGFLNGQLIMMDKGALHDVGGWASVSGAVLEDVAMGHRLKAAGHRVRLGDLRAIASTRMYASFSEIVSGFTKNIVAALGGPLLTSLIGVASFVVACLAPLGCYLTSDKRSVLAIFGAFAWILTVQIGVRSRTLLKVPGWVAIFAPLTYLVVMLVLCRASFKVVTKGKIAWRGRRYTASRK